MNGKSLAMLGLALLFGLGAMMLSRQMLSKEAGKSEETQEVLIAARDIKAEESLKPDMLTVNRMAKSAVPAGSFSSPKDVEERWVKTVLLEGDVIVEKKLGPKGAPPGLVANIPPGMRAFALDVTEQSGVSGFVLPGHRVDVVRYEADQGVQAGETILQNILVLASGQVFTRADERTLSNRTVTLAVTPEQVDTLVAARGKGALSLSLRGLNDQKVVDRPKPKSPAPDPMEKRWKLEEERRKELEKQMEERRKEVERQMEELKAALAKKLAEPPAQSPAPAGPPRSPPRYTTIYRGIAQVHRVRIDQGGVSELPPRPGAAERAESQDRPDRFGTPAASPSTSGNDEERP